MTCALNRIELKWILATILTHASRASAIESLLTKDSSDKADSWCYSIFLPWTSSLNRLLHVLFFFIVNWSTCCCSCFIFTTIITVRKVSVQIHYRTNDFRPENPQDLCMICWRFPVDHLYGRDDRLGPEEKKIKK